MEFIANKNFANGRDGKGNLITYAKGKKYKADSKDVLVWANRGWVIVEKPKAAKSK